MTELIDSNSLLLLDNTSNTFRRRLTSELKILIPRYRNVYLTFDNDLHLIKLNIHDNNIIPQYNTFTFIIPNEYPFKYPKVRLNSDNYIDILRFYKKEELELVKQITGNDCLCCRNTCINSDTWGPSVTIDFIINEIKENLKIIENIKSQLNTDKEEQKTHSKQV